MRDQKRLPGLLLAFATAVVDFGAVDLPLVDVGRVIRGFLLVALPTVSLTG